MNKKTILSCTLLTFLMCIPIMPVSKNNTPVIQLPPPERQLDGVTCGSRALITAWAIDQLVKNKQEVTLRSIKLLFDQKKQLMRPHAVEALEIEEWNKIVFNIENLFIFQQNYASKTYQFQPATWAGFDSIEEMYQAIRQIMIRAPLNNTASLHIIYNTGGHWTLISYIKEYNKQPRLLYIDSSDQPLERSRSSKQFVNAFWHTFTKPAAGISELIGKALGISRNRASANNY